MLRLTVHLVRIFLVLPVITSPAEDMNVRVPDDVQIIGFDGIRYFGNGEYICSTIVQPIADIASVCVDLLLQEQSRLNTPLICLPVTYAAGGTTNDITK